MTISYPMRYCFGCHHFSADGPLCTQCGCSFGGRRCHSKKHHLNPPDAKVCGQCGTSDLAEAAFSLGCPGRLFLSVLMLGLIGWGGEHLGSWACRVFYGWTGFRSPAVWLIEKCAHVLIILFVFYFLSLLMPGEAGPQFRNLISKLSMEALKFFCKVVWKILTLLAQFLLGSVDKEDSHSKK